MTRARRLGAAALVIASVLTLALVITVGLGKRPALAASWPYFQLAPGTGNGTSTSAPAYTRVQDSGTNVLTLPAQPYASDAILNGSAYGLFTTAFLAGFNGSSSDRLRVDPNATGVLRVTTGGASNAAIAPATAGPTAVKGSAGRLARVVVTVAGTASETFYDNASACSGTVIAVTPASTSVGTVIDFQMPAANGITGCGGAGSPGLTVSYS